MAVNIPSSQQHSGLATARLIAKAGDLTADQELMCDDLIIKLNEPPLATLESDRAGLGALVFEKGWGTNRPITQSGALRSRRGVDMSSMTETDRRPGVYQAQPHWGGFGIPLSVYDKAGSHASAGDITWNEGWTLQRARAVAMMHWDLYGVERVTEHNFKLVVCWAESRCKQAKQFRVQRVQTASAGPSRSIFQSIQDRLNGRKVDYDALSYVWGGPPQRGEIINCDGRALEITASLANAIKRLRPLHQPRTLWIDQICINQKDNTEKSKQVLLMGDIFRNADQVIAWLGEDPEEYAPIAKRFLDEVAQGHFRDVENRFAPARHGFLARHGLPEVGAPEWRSINALVALPYFTRVWILQEVILARRLTFKWGRTEIAWEPLSQFATWAGKNPSLYNYRGVLLDQKGIFRLFNYQVILPDETPTFEECILKVKSRSCTVEVDRIYSVLGLVGDGPSVLPDYSLSASRVFQDVTLAVCKLRRGFDILGDVHYWEENELRPSEWPTWVPRWNRSNPTQITMNGSFAASAPLRFVPPRLTETGSTLELNGIVLHVGSVARNADVLASQSRDEGISVSHCVQHIWGAWVTLTGDTAAKARNKRLIHNFIWALVCGTADAGLWNGKAWAERDIYLDFAAWWADRLLCRVIEGVEDAREFVSTRIMPAGMAALMYHQGQEPSLESCHSPETWESRIRYRDADPNQFDQDLATIKPEIMNLIAPRYGEHTAEAVAGELACFYPNSNHSKFRRCWTDSGISRSFFILEGGYIGMGPHIMRDTDVVAIFAGSSIPYALRPTGDAYMLLGDCYVQGIMQGELLSELESKGLLKSCIKTILLC
ncbi:hypothetical protein OQA88_3241 [Cercophora sp. LCS_1]